MLWTRSIFKMRATSFVLLALASVGFSFPAAPSPIQARQEQQTDLAPQQGLSAWAKGATTEWQIHSSCNASEARQLRQGLAEAVELAGHASEHILRWGNSSEIYQKYFGDAPTGEAIGFLEKIASGDRGGVLFRCDNPDGNCALEGWGGHWRGENATGETVICPLSYETRRSLVQMCALGYTVSGSESNTFWASDLMHRLYHMPAFGEGAVEHLTEGYADVLEMVDEGNTTMLTRDSDTLQYFALEAYAHDIAVPGKGCPGNVTDSHDDEPAASTATTGGAPVSTTASAPAECHTHSDGDVHCE
ncbi:hypothetical protein CLAIMM_11966 [Cladophialophora immunda]|nr:hypothetical protein CLAIMM_11966 [Cladophialophora immunda]